MQSKSAFCASCGEQAPVSEETLYMCTNCYRAYLREQAERKNNPSYLVYITIAALALLPLLAALYTKLPLVAVGWLVVLVIVAIAILKEKKGGKA